MLNNNNNKNEVKGAMRHQSNEAHSVFARIMSTENIQVNFDPKSKDAWFDTKTRILNMPNWTGMTQEVYDLLLSHEVSHALHTPATGWIGLTDELAGPNASDADKQVAQQYINIVEDARIERLIKSKYPGLARDYRKGYEWLLKSDMFGKLDNAAISEMAFIDRLNLHFKVGQHTELSVPFSASEQQVVDMIAEAESFEDVMKATRLVWDHESSTDAKPQPKTAKGNGSGAGNGDGDGKPQDGDGEPQDGEADGEGKPTNQPSKQLNRIAPKTTQAQQKWMEKHREKTHSWQRNDDAPVRMPEFDLAQIIVPHTQINDQITEALNSCTKCKDWRNLMTADYNAFASEANATVDAMVKTFLTKKAANAHHRQQQAKSGTLDMNLLSTYKWNEDLFKHFTIKPNGKNHGFVVFLDWSGSMAGVIMNVVKQMYILTSFFRRIGVPYEVYAFSSHQPTDKYEGEYKNYYGTAAGNEMAAKYDTMQKTFITNAADDVCETRPFWLYQFASNTMNTTQYKTAMHNLFALGFYAGNEASRKNSMSLYHPAMPHWLGLGDTPLDQALMAANQIVSEFQRKYRIQIMNTVVITDGSTSGSPLHDGKKTSGGKYITPTRLVNKRTGSSFSLNNIVTTNVLAAYLQDNTGSNTIMLFLDQAQTASSVRIPGYATVHPNGKQDESLNSHWTNENFLLALPTRGHEYDHNGYAIPSNPKDAIGFKQVYAIRIPRKEVDDTFEDMDIGNTAYSRLKNQFVKSLQRKIVSRSLVSRMVEGMAKHT